MTDEAKERKRAYMRAYRLICKARDPERFLARHREWCRKYRERSKNAIATNRAYRQRNPQKHYAHSVVYVAVKSGKLIRPDACSKCGSVGRVQGHHADYSKPLDVVWVCPPCHKSIHTEMANA